MRFQNLLQDWSKPIQANYQFERNGIEKEKRQSGGFRSFRGLQVKNGLTLNKYISHMTGLEEASSLEASRNLCIEAAALGFEALLNEHSALWHQRWEACDIQIEGDEEAQQALRFSLYHLLSIVPAHTQHASIPARGMSGQMYKGAIFWDTEIFMLPFFSHTFPDYARNLLLYRYHTLSGARRKAQEYGYRGAFYAWESQDTGDDACSLFNVTDIFTNRPVRTYFRDKQIHISADIPYAYWQYYTVTGDESIWRDGGAEVVFECARFFLSYLYYNPGKRRYEILDVTGADEYHERVHNNAFTNRMVAHTFDICQRIAKILHDTAPDFYARLMGSLDFEADLALISEVSSALFQPDLTATGNLIPQFDGYFALENPSLETLLERRLHPNEYLGGGNGLATTTQIIKQADVVLMLYLFESRYTLAAKNANWEYYEPRTEHGSSLSPCSYSVIAAHLGKLDWAYKYFMKTATIDLIGNGKQYAGSLYIGGTHPAGSGGAWISIVMGFCGLECSRDTITLQPNLPVHWQKVTLPIIFHDQRLRISITHEHVAITPVNPLKESLSLISKRIDLFPPFQWRADHPSSEFAGTPVIRSDAEFKSIVMIKDMRAAIFDLDGVIVDTAKYHYLAWKRLAKEYGFDICESDNERLKGVSRLRSLDILLEIGGLRVDDATKLDMAAKKNDWYVEYINQLSEAEVLPGAKDYLRLIRRKGVRTALGSASKNAPLILEKLAHTIPFRRRNRW